MLVGLLGHLAQCCCRSDIVLSSLESPGLTFRVTSGPCSGTNIDLGRDSGLCLVSLSFLCLITSLLWTSVFLAVL